MKYILIILLFFTNFIFPQTLRFISEFGGFNSASSFDVDLQGNIYITDISENTITKIDSNGVYLNSIGGYGWGPSSFDEPTCIVTTTLSIYVADKNNNRIQRFDKDLNYLSNYSGKKEESDIEFGYPTSLDISHIGDLYILETDNNRILKYSLTGQFLLEIGANDAGGFALTNPKNFSIDPNGNIYVLDDKRIKVFDQYGNGQLIYEITFNPHRIYNFNNFILYIEDEKIIVFDLKARKIAAEFSQFINKNDEIIVDAKILGGNLFLLTSNKLLKYRIKF